MGRRTRAPPPGLADQGSLVPLTGRRPRPREEPAISYYEMADLVGATRGPGGTWGTRAPQGALTHQPGATN